MAAVALILGAFSSRELEATWPRLGAHASLENALTQKEQGR
jgi:hypothetical protein